ncbi:hypothetical protein INT45_004599 [Circinella minor]|uniref:Heterokaryon incompatibility domain-containing protein n=1 Tax=Circinella minor TaxID=1195481 RepID=A0A8H7RU94_9FUNG|nr:hypothetical protein INT45_004599 [Circinella minor]
MYITYCRNQNTVDLEDKTSYRLGLTGGDYRPTWLVRVSDWKRVPGEAAVDGYHTLSYCWEQSGEVVKRENDNNDYHLVDNSEHCVVEGYDADNDFIMRKSLSPIEECDLEESIDPEVEEKNNKYVTWCEPISETTTLKHVTYEELLQQLCKDFQVEYLWYDKVCIDQSDKKHKSDEIKQMHQIYCNARYTIVLIPELIVYDLEDFDQEVPKHGTNARKTFLSELETSFWMKRSWTLEEVMMSKHILVVGTDVNMFQHSLYTPDTPPTAKDRFSESLIDFGGQIKRNNGSVNQALTHAHFRTSTKPHDMIFALKNIFASLFDDIEMNYSTDVQETFNDFYRHIATKDLSILCFGANLSPNGTQRKQSTMGDYNLPSWTGVDGLHLGDHVYITTHSQLSYTMDNSMKMNIKTNHYWKIAITKYKYGPYYFSKEHTPESKHDYLVEQKQKIHFNRSHKKLTDLAQADKDTILAEWFTNMHIDTGHFMTHYHYRQHDENNPLTQLRPLSLTHDCEEEECIVLPILFQVLHPTFLPVDKYKSIRGPKRAIYLLPVFCKCPNDSKSEVQYKAVGVYLLGNYPVDNILLPFNIRFNKLSPTFNWNHCVGRDDIDPVQDPKDILNILFENDYHDVPKKFIIE